MKRFGLFVLAAILILGGAAYVARGPIALKLFRAGAYRQLASDPLARFPDGLNVGLCGAGAPLPSPTRAEPCVVVVAGRQVVLIDAGEGASRNLSRMGLAPGLLKAVFLTHYHSDHIDGLGSVMLQRWAGSAAAAPLPVYGPPGVETVVAGFNQVYSLDDGYRVAHHGPLVVPPAGAGGLAHPFTVAAGAPPKLVLDQDGLKVYAFLVDHRPVQPAVGYALTYKGRKAVISGDTRQTPSVADAARGADLLVHEALSPTLVRIQEDAARAAGRTNLAHIFHDIVGYHTTPEQAAQTAQTAHVRYLLLDHIVPALPIRGLEVPFLGQAHAYFKGPIRVGRDGDMIELPAGGTDVIYRRLF